MGSIGIIAGIHSPTLPEAPAPSVKSTCLKEGDGVCAGTFPRMNRVPVRLQLTSVELTTT